MLERATCVDPSSRVNVCARWLEIQAVIIVPMPHQNGGHGCQVGSMLSELGGVVLKGGAATPRSKGNPASREPQPIAPTSPL